MLVGFDHPKYKRVSPIQYVLEIPGIRSGVFIKWESLLYEILFLIRCLFYVMQFQNLTASSLLCVDRDEWSMGDISWHKKILHLTDFNYLILLPSPCKKYCHIIHKTAFIFFFLYKRTYALKKNEIKNEMKI